MDDAESPSSGLFGNIRWPEANPESPRSSSGTYSLYSFGRSASSRSSYPSEPPTSPHTRHIPKMPSAIVVKSSLTVPDENRMPDSPGFPTMLAAMTFPSPPTKRKSSAYTDSDTTSRPNSVSASPLAHRHPSSKNTVTLSAPVSLNEIVMTPTQLESSFSFAEVVPMIHSGQDNSTSIDAAAHETTMPRTSRQSFSISEIPCYDRPDSVLSNASFVTAREERQQASISSMASILDSRRHSVAASITATNSSYQQSVRNSMTTMTSGPQSARSFATTIRTTPSLRFEDLDGPENPECGDPSDRSDGVDTKQVQAPTRLPLLRIASEPMNPYRRPSEDGMTRTISLAERRMARKGQVAMLRERGLDIALSRPGRGLVGDPVDSPVLGWFQQTGVPARKTSLHGSSPLANAAQTSVATSPASGHIDKLSGSVNGSDESLKANGSLGHLSAIPEPVANPPAAARSRAPSPARNQWSISPIMATEVEPEVIPDEPTPLPHLTTSSIFIVANIEPQSPPPSLDGSPNRLRLPTLLGPSAPTAVPLLPARSPLRSSLSSRNQQMRSKGMPLKITGATSTNGHRRLSTNSNVIHDMHRGNALAMHSNQPPILPKRLSLPVHAISSPGQSRAGDRSSMAWLHAPPPSLQPERKVQPRRRSVVVRERFEKKRLEKVKEIADLVASTSPTSALEDDEEEAVEDEDKNTSDYWEKQLHTTTEIERRIKRLEKHSDAWASVLDPLLDNMNRTLREMKRDGRGGPLLMGEFMIDMTAEARRSMYSMKGQAANDLEEAATFFENFDGIHQPVESKLREYNTKMTKKSTKSERSSRLRLELESSPRPPTELSQQDVATGKLPDDEETGPGSPELLPIQGHRTTENHEYVAQEAIRRRLDQQEDMMDQLMNKWGIPSPNPLHSYRMRVSEGTELPSPRGGTLAGHGRTRSRASSIQTALTSCIDDSDADTLDVAYRGFKSAPLSRHWLKKKGNNNKRPSSRKSNRRQSIQSRRRSSIGERTNLSGFEDDAMNAIMTEIRNGSRLSLESRGDIRSIF
ncbi:hypothetical protein BX600DRAFT_451169 [Xylariales sp. PMI_506]|nr:hypothetical protein BX600DRAFT_451169 [Xylariales sp. PMI_506]